MEIIFYGKDRADVVDKFKINEDVIITIQELTKQQNEKALEKLFSNLEDIEGNKHNIDINKIVGFEVNVSASK